MKKTLGGLFGMVFILSQVASGASWQMDSSPFSFSATSIHSRAMDASQRIGLRYSFDATQGVVTIHYSVIGSRGATLNVYNLSGGLLKSIKLQPGSTSIQWRPSQNVVAAGVYLASLKSVGFEKQIRITTVK